LQVHLEEYCSRVRCYMIAQAVLAQPVSPLFSYQTCKTKVCGMCGWSNYACWHKLIAARPVRKWQNVAMHDIS
jgi:hypothetical protein